MTKMNVESFNLDHTKVVAPYIRLAGTMEGIALTRSDRKSVV